MMDIITATSDNKPCEHTPLRGPTVTLYRTGVTEVTITTETEAGPIASTFYRYKELRFIDGEYDLVRQGSLPIGADEWTDDLRSIERSFLYDQADVKLAKASDYDTPEWTVYAEQVRAYKREVRESKNQPGYPAEVTYPTIPEQPN